MSKLAACRKALNGILSAWRMSTAPSELIRSWLEQARELVTAEGESWTAAQRWDVVAELDEWAIFIKAHPDEYAMEAGEISFNSRVAKDCFPTLNMLYDQSPGTGRRPEGRRRRRRAGGDSPPARSRTRSRSPKREPDSSDDERPRSRTERSLAPHPARHPEQYKLVRLRPL